MTPLTCMPNFKRSGTHSIECCRVCERLTRDSMDQIKDIKFNVRYIFFVNFLKPCNFLKR